MTIATLHLQHNVLTLPDEWLEDFKTDTVAAVRLGDVVVLRPVETVQYSPEAEKHALAAIAAFDEAKKNGEVYKLGDKMFKDLLKEADAIS